MTNTDTLSSTNGETLARPVDPAFPVLDDYAYRAFGVSRRDLFAALALQGLLARHSPYEDPRNAGVSMLAGHAVALADALLAELSRPREPDPG